MPLRIYNTLFFFLSNLVFLFWSIFFSPTDSWFSRWKLTNLNNFSNSVDISLSRLWQKRSCTRQMQFFHECLPGRYAVYNHRLQSADVSCPNRARTHRSDCQNRVCNHPKHGRNQFKYCVSYNIIQYLLNFGETIYTHKKCRKATRGSNVYILKTVV